MRIEKHTVNVPTSVAAGTPTDISTAGPKTIFVEGTFVATIQFQISPDGTSWDNLGSPFTAPGHLSVTDLGMQLRANVTAYTSGTPSAWCFSEYATEGG